MSETGVEPDDGAFAGRGDAATRERGDTLRAGQARVLEVAVQGTLAQTLEALAHMVEALSVSGVLASILILDEDGARLRHGAGPSLPAAYNEAIDGIAPGPRVGSCGTAVHMKAAVYVSDIADDPLWADFRELALSHGLRACWSIPIISGDGDVLGTFAMYHQQPRKPSPTDLELVDFVIRTAALVIERKRVEERLRDSEEQLRLATEAAEVGLWDLDPRLDTLFWPPRVKAMFGISADRPISMADFYAGLHPDDAGRTGDAFAAALDPDRRSLYEVEYRTIGKEDGIVRWVAAKGRGVFDESGRCTRVLGTALDITARKATDQALIDLNETLEQRVAEALAERRVFANIVENTDAAVLACDLDFGVVAINAATATHMERIYGVRPKVGDNLLGALDAMPEHRAQIERHWRRGLSGEEFVFVDEFGDPGRERIFFEVRFHPLRDREGTRIGAFQTAFDVTERVRASAELEAAQEALRQAQKMEAVGQLTGGLAHDFNNLLTGMMGNLELLQARVARGRLDDLDRFINAAQGAGRRAASLTQRLLAFSRRQTLDPKPTDVNRLIVGLEELLRRTVGPAHNLGVVQAAGLWTAMIDPAQLENALLNLTINARDAMPDGGRLTIETANKWLDDRTGRERDLAPGQYLSICVTDTGTGMTSEVAARAFDPFFTTKPIGEGTGLGLSMIYGFARQSGGQVRIYSEVGEGTTVCIYLPRHAGEAADAAADAGTVSADQARGETVLVVDDEATIRHLIDEILEELGYTVIGVGDGAAGIKVLQSGVRIDLLITDVGLPNGMNGRQVADAARALRPGLKVLFITGYAENAAVGNGHLERGMELLTKPFAMADLTRKVQDMLAKARDL